MQKLQTGYCKRLREGTPTQDFIPVFVRIKSMFSDVIYSNIIFGGANLLLSRAMQQTN